MMPYTTEVLEGLLGLKEKGSASTSLAVRYFGVSGKKLASVERRWRVRPVGVVVLASRGCKWERGGSSLSQMQVWYCVLSCGLGGGA